MKKSLIFPFSFLFSCLFSFLLIFCFIFTSTKSFSQKKPIYLDLNTNIGYFLMNDKPFHIAKVIDQRKDTTLRRARRTNKGIKDIFFKTDAETEIFAYFKKILPPKIPNNIPITFVLLELNVSQLYYRNISTEYMPNVFIKGVFLDKDGQKLCVTTASFRVKDKNQSFRQTYRNTHKTASITRTTNEIHYINGIQEALKGNLIKFDKIWKKKNGNFDKIKSTK